MSRSGLLGLNLVALGALAAPALLIARDLEARAAFGPGMLAAFAGLFCAGMVALVVVMVALASRRGERGAFALLPLAALSTTGAVALLVGLSFQTGV
jgi:hypothetical protein